MLEKKYWKRAWFTPVWPLGEDGRCVTGSEAHKQLALEAAREGMVLTKNNGVLPLAKGQKLAVFGVAQADYVRHGTGAADVHNVKDITLLEGLRRMEEEGALSLYKPSSEYYENYFEENKDNRDKEGVFQPELLKDCSHYYKNSFRTAGMMLEPVLPEGMAEDAAKFTDTALVTISRSCGEFYDRTLTPGDFYLDENEKALLAKVEKLFPKVILTLNIAAQLEAGFLEDPALGAVLFMWHPGQMGGLAAAEILCGKVNPSGKLVDTIARNYEDFPTAENFLTSNYYVDYDEDIFVGYRYFETIPGAKQKVVYPFGFGLSYTKFKTEVLSAAVEDGTVKVEVSVKNIGKMAGKEVVQLYYGAPQGKLGKAARELAAFAKTQELAPRKSETLTLSFKVSDMASYDDTGLIQKSAWLLEAGTYSFYCGTDVRTAKKCLSWELAETTITEQLTECCPPQFLPRRMKANGKYETVAFRIPKEPNYAHPEASKAKAPAETVYLDDVMDGKVTMDEFLAQMSPKELISLVGGAPCGGICATRGFAGLEKYGIPVVGTSDAPGGLRIQRFSGVLGTSFPTATAVACSWNEQLAYDAALAIAEEIKENNMYAWLGPAMNIHRNPLSGRNFEYYSEDPLIAGKFAAASVRGCQSIRISASPKHFAVNNKDRNRKESDSRLSERALREIYLKNFEICVKESDPKTIMTSYNLINGEWAAQNPDTITHILREEWGFKGLVMTDWSGHGMNGKEVMAGSDMKMSEPDDHQVFRFFRDKDVTRGMLEACARNLCNLLLWFEGCDEWK